MTAERRECECGADGPAACGFWQDGADGLCAPCRAECVGAPIRLRVRHGAGDPVNHPNHYVDVVPGVECIQVVEHFSFLRGNAIKYLWRAGSKGDALTDLRKAAWYVQREIDSLDPIDVTGRS